jgi:Peptidase A4 family
MRAALAALAAGAAVTLAAGLALPAAAQAATASVASVPAPQKTQSVAGYEQEGCRNDGYPVYVQIQGTITVPAATDINGTPGISSDYYSIGGPAFVGATGPVAGGVSVDNSGGQAFYVAYGEWDGKPVTAFSVQPGDKLDVTIEQEGSSDWMVELSDSRTGQEWSQTNPSPGNAVRCAVGAFEGNDYPSYDYLTQTTPVAFDFTRVLWGEQGQPVASVSKLLGNLPAYALLFRYNLTNSSGTVVAATSKPADSDNNFTVTDK